VKRFLPATESTLAGLRIPDPHRAGRLPVLLEALARLEVIRDQCARIQETTRKLSRVTQAVTTEYTKGVQMLDLEASLQPPDNAATGVGTPPEGDKA